MPGLTAGGVLHFHLFIFIFFLALPEATFLCVSLAFNYFGARGSRLQRAEMRQAPSAVSALCRLEPRGLSVGTGGVRQDPGRTGSLIRDVRSRSWRRCTQVQFRYTRSVEEKNPSGNSYQGNPTTPPPPPLLPGSSCGGLAPPHFFTCPTCGNAAQFRQDQFAQMRRNLLQTCLFSRLPEEKVWGGGVSEEHADERKKDFKRFCFCLHPKPRTRREIGALRDAHHQRFGC